EIYKDIAKINGKKTKEKENFNQGSNNPFYGKKHSKET
ncbi:unnamed protein product, partial [marine sediment metagenome]